jgi:hypothetical protein
MRSSLSGDVTQCRLVFIYRRFGTIYWSHLQGSKQSSLVFLFGRPDIWRLDKYVVLKRRQLTTTLRCVISQKNGDPSFEPWSRKILKFFEDFLSPTWPRLIFKFQQIRQTNTQYLKKIYIETWTHLGSETTICKQPY